MGYVNTTTIPPGPPVVRVSARTRVKAVQRYAGRWAGDEVYLIGDYDHSKLYEKAIAEYHNISRELAEEYNRFVELDDHKLKIGT